MFRHIVFGVFFLMKLQTGHVRCIHSTVNLKMKSKKLNSRYYKINDRYFLYERTSVKC